MISPGSPTPSQVSEDPPIASGDKAELLRDVLLALEEAGHKYCVMHSYGGYPNDIPSDVDILSEAPAEIPRILAEARVASTVQALEHEANAFYYVLHRNSNNRHVFLALDASSDFRRDGRVFFRSAEVFRDSRVFRSFRVPSASLEFAYCLVKRIAKASLPAHHARRLEELYQKAQDSCTRWIESLLPNADGILIRNACRSGNWTRVESELSKLRRDMLERHARQRPAGVFAYWLAEMRRRVSRILRPTGMIVAFIGPDGVGKSTVMREVERTLAPAFRATHRYHLRPHFGKQSNRGAVTNPHAKAPRGPILSTAKIILWWIDYRASFWLDVLPRLIRSTLVLFDRYYDDVLVDPLRYRYGGPMWLARRVSRHVLLGSPIVICLDAPPEVIRTRKAEVSVHEIARQREAYLQLTRRLSKGRVVDASRPVDEVAAEVSQAVLRAMTERTALMLKLRGSVSA